MNHNFDFKQFTIFQEKSAMKVGTDGVLLGAWAKPSCDANSDLSILDIGTGTGVIALMMAQRFPNAVITAIEIDHDAAEEAKTNAGNSPWSDRISVVESALSDFDAADVDGELCQYDLIVTNPPFYNATLKPNEATRAVARHCDSLPFSDITRFADSHLSSDGILAVIYPTNCEQNIMLGVTTSSLTFHTICDVVTKEGKPAKRRMACFSRKSYPLKQECLVIRNASGDYSDDYRNLVNDFYINLN